MVKLSFYTYFSLSFELFYACRFGILSSVRKDWASQTCYTRR